MSKNARRAIMALVSSAALLFAAIPTASAAQSYPTVATCTSCPIGKTVSIHSRSTGNTYHYHNSTYLLFQNGNQILVRESGIGLNKENWQTYSTDLIDTSQTYSFCVG